VPLRNAAPVHRQSATTKVLRLMLGALFISVFFDNLHKQLYDSAGYAHLIEDYKAQGNAPGVWKDFMGFIADHASFFGPVQAVFELTLGIVLVLGVGAGVFGLIAAAHLTALWISELAPRRWVWELLSLIVVAVVVSIGSLPTLLDGRRSWTERILGPPTFRSLPLPGRLAVAVLCGSALTLVLLAAKTGTQAHYTQVAWQSGVTFGVAVAAMGVLDYRRAEREVAVRA
jgi:uncharacterized membrane protein YphA (DoxX/SURF4 family)